MTSRYHLRIKKVLAYLVIGPILGLAGCAFDKKDSQPKPSVLEKLPFVHKMTVQQGNIVYKEKVDRLKRGITKSQVRFLLGTPMLTDLFHTNRWDYIYTMRRGHSDTAVTRLTLLFKADRLVKIQRSHQLDPNRVVRLKPINLVIPVPNWQDDHR